MTITAWVGFNRKPNKSPGAAVARAFGMKERQTAEFEWLFQKSKFRVMLEDLREQMKPDYREWADEVGWPYNYALQIAVHDKRDSLDYIKWVALIAVLMEAYEQTVLWFDYGTDSPVTRHKLVDFAQFQNEMKEGEPETSQPTGIQVEEETDLFLEPSPRKKISPIREDGMIDSNALPAGMLDMIRKEMEADTGARVPEEQVRQLVPLEADDDFDDFEDWDDDDELDDDDDDDDVGGQAVTWD